MSDIHSEWGKAAFGNGWWFKVFKDGKLYAHGSGYKRKEKCFRHQRESAKKAEENT